MSKKKILTFISSVIFLTSLLFINPCSTFGQEINLTLSPPLIELTIKPGKSILIAYKLENHGNPSVFSTKILPFQPSGDTGQIKLAKEFSGPIRFNLDNSEIKLANPFFLKSNQNQQLLLRIRTPVGAPEGAYYYSFLAETVPEPAGEGKISSRAKATIGANILITVTKSGHLNFKTRVALFQLLSRLKFHLFGQTINLFDSNDPIPLVFDVANLGANLVKPKGEITLKGLFGTKAHYQILPKNILAYSQRRLSATPSGKLDCSLCKTPPTLVLNGFFLGRYYLSTSVNFGNGSPQLSAATSFIAFPFKLTLVLLIIIPTSFIVIKRLKGMN